MRLPRLELPALAAILGLMFGSIAYPLSDYDYFWHLRTGYLILESGSIPTHDPYSFTATGVPWEVQGWLFDLMMAWVHRAAGDAGLRTFFTLWIVAAWSVVHATVRIYVRDTSRALPITLASAAGASMYFVARPLVATLLGFAITLLLLLKCRGSGRAVWLLGIPVVMAVWVNMHFGFVTGLGLIVLFFTADTLSRAMPIRGARAEKGALTAARFGILLVACLAALGASPGGYATLWTMIEMTRLSAASPVVEWQSPNFHLPGPLAFLLPVGLAILANMLSRWRADWIDIVLLSALTGGALYSMRHMPLAAIALAPVIARGFSGWAASPWENRWLVLLPQALRERGGQDLGDRAYTLNLVLLVIGFLAVVVARPVVQAWQFERLKQAVPVEAADFLAARQLPGPLLNEYATGGYLIWRMHPQYKVFIDGRFTPYPPEVFGDYMRITHMNEGWLRLLDRYGIQTVLIRDPKAGLAQALLGTGLFRLVYADESFGVLLRADIHRPDLEDVRAHTSSAMEGRGSVD